MEIQVLLVGDVVGKPGRTILKNLLPRYIEENEIDFVIVNGENAAQGTGITENLFREVVNAGADVVTTGDHTWRRREILPVLERDPRALRPLNFPPSAVGRGAGLFDTRKGVRIGVVTVLGRIFMDPVDCPFRSAERAIRELRVQTPLCFLEIHAEATSEKQALAWRFAGEVSCVFGTHTHVPTADARILPGGTAYVTDLGMTGPYDSIIGRDTQSVLHKFQTSMHAPFHVASGDVRLAGAKVRVDAE
ncbi:MAG: TIGR00282 family metallophosphoesterase, partial [Acidobacteria bacterium]|nr:TIGR00282 family metallophosphoesterase [Acidobacteriota bacterium]